MPLIQINKNKNKTSKNLKCLANISNSEGQYTNCSSQNLQ